MFTIFSLSYFQQSRKSLLSSTRNEDVQINQNVHNITSSYEYDSQLNARFERPYSESSISCYSSKVELKCLRDPIASRVTLVNIKIYKIILRKQIFTDLICVVYNIFRFMLMGV